MKFWIFIFLWAAQTVTASAQAAETVAATVVVEGDLKGNYAFNGPLGSRLKAAATGEGAKCQEASAVFRRATYRKKPSLDVFMTLDCNFEGQKRHYKLVRIYLDLARTEHRTQHQALSEEIRTVHVIFRDLSLKLGK